MLSIHTSKCGVSSISITIMRVAISPITAIGYPKSHEGACEWQLYRVIESRVSHCVLRLERRRIYNQDNA